MRIRRRKIALLIFLILFSTLVISLHSCTFRMSPSEIDQYFASRNLSATQHHYKTGFRDIHYVKAGDDTKPLVVFIHGSPGSLSAFIDFLTDTTLRSHALLITTDRPGFGYSNFGNGEPSLQKQSAALKPILEQHKTNQPIILVGHSLGGPLIAQMAIDYPDLVKGLIIVAGSIDPTLEPNETWFRAPLATPFLSWVLPRSFRASNEEIYKLKPELERMLPLWQDIKCPVIVIQGTKDELVPKENADFAKRMMTNTTVDLVLIDGMNHFVPWSHPHLIKQAILKMLQNNSAIVSQAEIK
jgi:pimeloyl-ACP methyl ester carboxylesterase